MATNITPSSANSNGSPERMVSPRRRELVKLQGAGTAAGDVSAAYLSQLSRPALVEGGAFTVAATGSSCVFTSLIPLGTNPAYVWLCEAQ